MSERYLGVDIGGTKVAAAVVDAGGRILGAVKVPSRQPGVPVLDVIWAGMEKGLAAAGCSWEEIRAVGIGAPGPVEPGEGLWWGSTNLAVENPPVPLGAAIRARSGRPVFAENDVKAAGLGEFHFGCGKELGDAPGGLLFISVGTGLAASLLVGGRLFRGRQGAGEIGHIPVEPGGHPCGCGNRGCLETVAAGRALARWGREVVEAGWSPRLLAACGNDPAALHGGHVMQAAQEGDEAAAGLVLRLARGIALAIVIGLRAYDPAVVVLGGGVIAGGGAYLWERVQEAFAALAPRFSKGKPVRVSALGEHAGVLGAAAVALAGMQEV